MPDPTIAVFAVVLIEAPACVVPVQKRQKREATGGRLDPISVDGAADGEDGPSGSSAVNSQELAAFCGSALADIFGASKLDRCIDMPNQSKGALKEMREAQGELSGREDRIGRAR